MTDRMNETRLKTALQEGVITLTLGQLRQFRDQAYRLIDQLTSVSGHTQIVLALSPGFPIQPELEKILQAIQSASDEVQLCVKALNELENRALSLGNEVLPWD